MDRNHGPAGAGPAPLPAALAAFVVALSLALLVAPPPARAQEQAHPEAPAGAQDEAGRLAVVAAFTGAWNAHDLEVVGAIFAPAGSVRQRDAELTLHGPSVLVRDVFGVGLDYDGDPPAAGPGSGEVTWASGQQELCVWARRLFATGHRMTVTGIEADGDGETVRWDYAVTSGPARRLSGVQPTRGRAEAVLRQGQIVSLTLHSDAASVRTREEEFALAVARRLRRSP